MNFIIGSFISSGIGFFAGYMFEDLRLSILYHEARKGDAEALKVFYEMDELGQKIEDKFS